MKRSVVMACSTLGGLLAVGTAQAQPIGTFAWQQQPYCNVITLRVVQDGGVYHLDGSDDQCGAARRASASGIAFANPDGSIGMGLTLVTNNGSNVGGLPLHIDATVSLATVSGTWRDSTGQTGLWTFARSGSTGGAPRPVPSVPTVAANSVGTAALQAAAVTAQKLAPNSVTGASVVDGSLSMADVSDAPRAGASASSEEYIALGVDPVVLRSVIISVPAAGRIVANGSGTFRFGAINSTDGARCAISLTNAIVAPWVSAHEQTVDSILEMPFAVTASFAVSPGSVTVNLVCRRTGAYALVSTPSLTAIYVPGP